MEHDMSSSAKGVSLANKSFFFKGLHAFNQLAAVMGSVAIGIAACVLTWEATARYLF